MTHLRSRLLGLTLGMLWLASSTLAGPCTIDVQCHVYPDYTICVETVICI